MRWEGRVTGKEGELTCASSVIVPSKFEGKHIILLDELYDNGATMCSVKGKLRETLGRENDNEIFTCCLFQKEKEQSYPPPGALRCGCLCRVCLSDVRMCVQISSALNVFPTCG